MENNVLSIDDQPISSGFFGEGNWLSDYVTPQESDILMLWDEIAGDTVSREDKTIAAWDWVANNVAYKDFIKATINVEGRISTQNDYWQTPAMCSKTQVGNCVNKAFLLTSLLRNEYPSEQIHCVLGNLHNGKVSGHAWVEVNINGIDYIMESTRNDVPLLEVNKGKRYEPVHYVNDKSIYAVPGRTMMVPFSACYSDWLHDYINWAYIHGGS